MVTVADRLRLDIRDWWVNDVDWLPAIVIGRSFEYLDGQPSASSRRSLGFRSSWMPFADMEKARRVSKPGLLA